MKITKFFLFMLSVATLAFTAASCNNAANSNAAANNANKSNNATVVNSNQTTQKNTAPVSNTTPASANNSAVNKNTDKMIQDDNSDADKIDGELQMGKTESVILYVGAESGDYAAYCFANDSDAGRAILAACKDKEQCEVSGKIDYDVACKVPGLEADLSSSGRIMKVASAKSLGRKK